MDESTEQSKNALDDQAVEVAAAADIELNQKISSDVKVREFPKRKILIFLSACILLAIIGLIGTKYYLNFQEKQRVIADAKAALDAELKTSKTAFDSAQLELTPNSYKDAINDLKKVISADPHYIQAQKQIAFLNSVSDITVLMLKLDTDRTKFNSAYTQYENNYESIRQPLNSAMDYGPPAYSTVAMSYVGKADAIYKDLSSSVDNVNESVATVSNDLGSISSNSYLSPFGNTNQVLSSFQSISEQVTTIRSAAGDQIDSLKHNSFDYTLISNANSSNDILGKDITSVKQGIAALTGFANGKVNDLLEEARRLNQ